MDINQAVKNLANLVYDTRTRMNLSQRKFAKLFQTTSSSISNLENGNYLDLPEHRTLNRFATDILKIKYSKLIEILEEDGEIQDLEDSTKITKDRIIAGLYQLESLEDVLDALSVLSEVADRLRVRDQNGKKH